MSPMIHIATLTSIQPHQIIRVLEAELAIFAAHVRVHATGLLVYPELGAVVEILAANGAPIAACSIDVMAYYVIAKLAALRVELVAVGLVAVKLGGLVALGASRGQVALLVFVRFARAVALCAIQLEPIICT